METPRWNIITPSQYEHERRGLDFVRAGLPDHDPYRAWSNFEFQTNDGAIYEVDLLVLTKQGFFLVEIKSWPGRVRGDAGTWTRTRVFGFKAILAARLLVSKTPKSRNSKRSPLERHSVIVSKKACTTLRTSFGWILFFCEMALINFFLVIVAIFCTPWLC